MSEIGGGYTRAVAEQPAASPVRRGFYEGAPGAKILFFVGTFFAVAALAFIITAFATATSNTSEGTAVGEFFGCSLSMWIAFLCLYLADRENTKAQAEWQRQNQRPRVLS